jgi:hypothetical protein
MTTKEVKIYVQDEDEDEDEDENLEASLDPRWRQARVFTALLRLNVEFVLSKITRTPYYSGPITFSSSKFINKLLELHEYGCLTNDGQEPLCSYEEYVPGKKGRKGFYVDEEQRGYLSFYLNIGNELDNLFAQNLLKLLADSKLIYTSYNFITKEFITNLKPEEKLFNLTRERVGDTIEELKEAEWEHPTNMQRTFNANNLLWGPPYNKILNKTLFIHIALPEYCKGDLESELISLCKAAGPKKYTLQGEYLALVTQH